MSWAEVVLASLNVFQFVALTWIAAWQQRAASEVRKLNGVVASEVRALARRTSTGGFAEEDPQTAQDPFSRRV